MNKTLQTLSLVALTSASVFQAQAGDREWATTGKILTGLVAAQAVANAFQPPVYYAPPAQVVYVNPPQIVQPAPQVVYQAPVYVPPPPVVVAAPVVVHPPFVVRPPVFCAPPLLSVNLGFGHHHHGRGHYRHHRHH